jgi:hypothetical protein
MGRQFFVGGNFKMYVTTQAVSTFMCRQEGLTRLKEWHDPVDQGHSKEPQRCETRSQCWYVYVKTYPNALVHPRSSVAKAIY